MESIFHSLTACLFMKNHCRSFYQILGMNVASGAKKISLPFISDSAKFKAGSLSPFIAHKKIFLLLLSLNFMIM